MKTIPVKVHTIVPGHIETAAYRFVIVKEVLVSTMLKGAVCDEFVIAVDIPVVVVKIDKSMYLGVDVIPGKHVVHVPEHFHRRLCPVLYGLQQLRTE